jgi:hypothetical protein
MFKFQRSFLFFKALLELEDELALVYLFISHLAELFFKKRSLVLGPVQLKAEFSNVGIDLLKHLFGVGKLICEVLAFGHLKPEQIDFFCLFLDGEFKRVTKLTPLVALQFIIGNVMPIIFVGCAQGFFQSFQVICLLLVLP